MLCYVMLCYTACYTVCYVMLCYVMLCYVMLCYVMLCYAMLCYVMLCYVMLCICYNLLLSYIICSTSYPGCLAGMAQSENTLVLVVYKVGGSEGPGMLFPAFSLGFTRKNLL